MFGGRIGGSSHSMMMMLWSTIAEAETDNQDLRRLWNGQILL
jgi:hypothetical protein